ncbi:MAG: SH3 domain-containing protein [Spirochaetia bacterium]|jgi:uncharacterized protein YgiM (DUF1202 family)
MKRFIVFWALVGAISASAATAPLGSNEAYVLLNNVALWQDSAGKLTGVENLAIGDKVTLLNQTSRFKEDGKDRDFARVRAPDGKEGWVRSQFLSTKSIIAVVKADRAVVFSEPREVKITGRYVSKMTIVAILRDGGTAGFARIQGYDRAQKLLLPDATYVSADDLTIADADVNAAILYAVADDNPKVKANLLKVAMTKYGGTIFLAALQAAAATASAVTRETTPASGTYVVNDDNVNVRAAPDEKSGQVIGKLNKGMRVDVTEMTAQTYTVAGSEAAWFHVKDPNGWVFGAFLEPTE